jgi:hypothetical protein
MNIRESTCLIIKRGSEFLVGRVLYSNKFRWSIYPWDAWKTRNRTRAENAARTTGGDLWLFNPVAGQLREVVRNE